MPYERVSAGAEERPASLASHASAGGSETGTAKVFRFRHGRPADTAPQSDLEPAPFEAAGSREHRGRAVGFCGEVLGAGPREDLDPATPRFFRLPSVDVVAEAEEIDRVRG